MSPIVCTYLLLHVNWAYQRTFLKVLHHDVPSLTLIPWVKVLQPDLGADGPTLGMRAGTRGPI